MPRLAHSKAGGGAFPSPAPLPSKRHLEGDTMDKTDSTVRIMLTAIEAPLYDVGVLSERGMLPRLDGISAAAFPERLSLLKYRNAHGSQIYIRRRMNIASPRSTISTRP